MTTVRPTAGDRIRHIGSRYALIGVWILMAAFFALMVPDRFLSVSAFQTIFGSQSVLVFLALAAMTTIIVGEFDLSFASVMGLAATTIGVLAGSVGLPIAVACLIAVGIAIVCGIVNAIFIVLIGLKPIIVTLGMGTLLVGVATAISSQTTVGVNDPAFAQLTLWRPFGGLPISFFYGLLVVLAFAYVLSFTPLGRHMVFVGANREVARLAGIHVNRIRFGSYVVAAAFAGVAGILLMSSIGGYDSLSAPTYLLPALAAVFLGTAVVSPGNENPIGTWIGIYFLATGIVGLQLLGFSGWISDVFYGGGLILAVAITHIVRTRTTTI
jgi:ribose transport system permease protein